MAEKKTVSADSGETFRTIANLWPYMWPADRPDLKGRVVYAAAFLVLAKLITVAIPYFFKWATDALEGNALDGVVVGLVPAALLAPARPPRRRGRGGRAGARRTAGAHRTRHRL